MTKGDFVDRDNKDLQQVWGLLMKGSMALLVIASALGGCAYLNEKAGLENDNHIEDALEMILEANLGLPENSIDFTPGDDE